MNRLLTLFLALLICCPLSAQVFKWTDSSGVVHFSDTPHPGAKTIDVPGIQKFSTPPAQGAAGSAAAPPPAPSAAMHEYTTLAITQPIQDETIRNNQGYVPIIISVEPELQSGDLLQVMFDGKAIGKPQSGKLFALNEIDRGTHTISVQVIGEDGTVLSSSEEVTFHMQRPRVGMVPGTVPRPPAN